METNNYILAIDLGTSGPKVAVYNARGQFIAYHFEKNEVHLLPGGGAEQDPAQWWQTIEKAYAELLKKTGIESQAIRWIGITGQWSGTVAVDKEGTPLAPALNWLDSRGHSDIQSLYKGPIHIQGYGVTSLLRWLYISNGIAGKSGKDPLAHILFLKRTQPELYEKTHRFLEPIDWLTSRFTGKQVASYHSITLHWLTNNRNLHQVSYHEPFLKQTGISRSKLPDLIPAGSIVGKITDSISKAWNLHPDTQVITASSDLMSAAVGSGAVRDGEPHVYIGTSGWLVCHLKDKKIDIASGMATLPSAMPGVYLLANEQENAGNCLNFLRDNILYAKDAFQSEKAPADFYSRLNEAAASIPAGSDKLIFFPWLYGERSPVEDHALRGGFFNMGLNHSRSHMARAVMEGVCLNARWLFSRVRKLTAKPPQYIHIIGGGAQSDLWCQIMADVLQCPVRRPKNPIIANTQGVAYLCLMAQGKTTRAEIAAAVQIDHEFQPNPTNKKIYDELYDVFTRFYPANRGFFKQLNQD